MLNVLLNPAVIALAALLLSILWMMRDETDRTRPFLVVAFVVNLFYGWLLSFFMGRENGLVPWKYDYVLARLDEALSIPTASIAGALQPMRSSLLVVYQLMVPMTIACLFVARRNRVSGSLVVAYAAEMVTGPLFYALVPGCGPLYAFRSQWLHPPLVHAIAIRLNGMPNAFPSLHTATALVLVSFARGRLWQTISILFLAGTLMATIATGEHYAIDLVAGLAFGCFAANAGRLRIARSAAYLALVLSWSLTVRFAHQYLIDHAAALQAFAGVTVLSAVAHVYAEWRSDQQQALVSVEPAVPAPVQGSI